MRGWGFGVLLSSIWLLVLASPASANEAVVRMATYNVNYGNPALDRVIAALEDADADIVALQEINAESERALRDAFEDRYPHMVFHPDRWAGGYGFMSRYPLDEVQLLEPTEGPFGTYLADVAVGGLTLRLANVHLQPNVPKRGEDTVDFIRRTLGLEQVRIAEVDDILEAMRSDDDAVRIVIGDLNTFRGMGTLRHLEASGFRDVFADVLDDLTDLRTWQWTLNGHTWRFRLDYVFVEGDALPATEVRIIEETRASDHFPVVVTLALTP